MKALSDVTKRCVARAIDARLEVARHELCCATARLYSPRARGHRLFIEISAAYNGVIVEIRGPELDAMDLGVLLAIYALAGCDVSDRDTCEARGMLTTDAARGGKQNAAADMESLRVCTSIAAIAAMIGRDPRDGQARKRIRQSIARLMSITVAGTRGEKWGATALIKRPRDEDGRLTLDLDFRATRAVMGEGQWAAISMQQWRECRGDLERVLLHRVAALTTGRLRTVSLDVLADRCWAHDSKGDHDRRWRRQQVRDALLAGRVTPAGITASIDQRGLVTFTRSQKHAG